MSFTVSDNNRIFALVDVNNFYVSCERAFDISLLNKAAVVLSNNDGCCIARSNEAKKMNISMGKPFFEVRHLEESGLLEVRSSNYALYADMSERFKKTLLHFTPDLEAYSIDECFLDLSKMKITNLEAAASDIRNTVLKWIHLPVCVGIAPTKALAKLANHTAKKNPSLNGVCVLTDSSEIRTWLSRTSVQDVWGIGPAYAKLLNKSGIHNALAFSEMDDSWLRKNMTVHGFHLARELRGISCMDLELIPPPKKGITVSRSFGARITELKDLKEAVALYASRASEKLWQEKRMASSISVMIRSDPFKKEESYYSNSQNAVFRTPTDNMNEIIKTALLLLDDIYRKGYRYKKAGVMLEHLIAASECPGQLFQEHNIKKIHALNALIRHANSGKKNSLVYAASGASDAFWHTKFCKRSPRYTSRWSELPRVK